MATESKVCVIPINRNRSRSPISRVNSNQKSNGDMPSHRPSSMGDLLDGGFRGGRRIMISNLPFETKWQEVKDYIRYKIGEVLFVEKLKENGNSTGRCLVEFRSAEMVAKAITQLHLTEFQGRKMVIREHGGPISGRGDRGGRIYVNNPYNTYGLQPDYLESLGITGPLTTKIFVANLDYNVTKEKVEEVFEQAGRMIKCVIRTNKDGKSRGQAVVEYTHPIEAVKAISMFNGQLLSNRKMYVRMDKYEDDALPGGLRGIGPGLGPRGQPVPNLGQCFAPIPPVNTVAPVGRGPVCRMGMSGSFGGNNFPMGRGGVRMGGGMGNCLGSMGNGSRMGSYQSSGYLGRG